MTETAAPAAAPARPGFRTLEAEQARPVATICTYDSGAATDCQPLCSARPVVRVLHLMACYGWFADDVCRRHEGPTLGRVYPDRTMVEPLR